MVKIIAMVGLPGTGKTTVTREFMKQFANDWERQELEKLVTSEFSPSRNLHVFGKYDEGETFAGTDRLAMSVQPQAIKFVENHTDVNIFFEGDRLGTQSFLEFIAGIYNPEDFAILKLHADERTLGIRYAQRGSNQSETFIKGRQTKIEGIGRNFMLMDYIHTFEHETPEDTKRIVEWMISFYQNQ